MLHIYSLSESSPILHMYLIDDQPMLHIYLFFDYSMLHICSLHNIFFSYVSNFCRAAALPYERFLALSSSSRDVRFQNRPADGRSQRSLLPPRFVSNIFSYITFDRLIV